MNQKSGVKGSDRVEGISAKTPGEMREKQQHPRLRREQPSPDRRSQPGGQGGGGVLGGGVSQPFREWGGWQGGQGDSSEEDPSLPRAWQG